MRMLAVLFAVLLAPLAVRDRPGRTAAAVALAVAAVVVLPIRDDQYGPWGIDNGCDG